MDTGKKNCSKDSWQWYQIAQDCEDMYIVRETSLYLNKPDKTLKLLMLGFQCAEIKKNELSQLGFLKRKCFIWNWQEEKLFSFASCVSDLSSICFSAVVLWDKLSQKLTSYFELCPFKPLQQQMWTQTLPQRFITKKSTDDSCYWYWHFLCAV